MEWNSIWGYCQIDYQSWPSKIQSDIQRITIVNNHDFSSIRMKFANLYGMEPIIFSKVSIRNLSASLDQSKEVTVLGSERVNLLPGSRLISDPIYIHANPGDVLQIETILAEPVEINGGIVTYSRRVTEVTNFDNDRLVLQKNLFKMVHENNRMQFIYGIEELLIPHDSQQTKIVFFGDSLVHQGFIVDQLTLRFLKTQKRNTSIINKGIGGSRILFGTDKNSDDYNRHGQSGLLRFEKDLYSSGPKEIIIVLHGINDILTTQYNNATEIINGLKMYKEIAHVHHSKVMICTLMPFGNSQFYSPALDEIRQEVNDWIRSSVATDDYFDLDKMVRDPLRPNCLDRNYDTGDGLHLNESGGRHIAKSMELNQIFEES